MRWRLSGDDWQVVPSLITLLLLVDEIWPDSHGTDSTLGDAEHRRRSSDHNPDENGDVRAADIGEVTEDDGFALAEALRISRDSRIKYVIHEGQLFSSYDHPNGPPFVWREYTGPVFHGSHVHISVMAESQIDVSSWNIGIGGGDLPLNEFERLVVDIALALGGRGNASYWYKKESTDDEFVDLARGVREDTVFVDARAREDVEEAHGRLDKLRSI